MGTCCTYTIHQVNFLGLFMIMSMRYTCYEPKFILYTPQLFSDYNNLLERRLTIISFRFGLHHYERPKMHNHKTMMFPSQQFKFVHLWHVFLFFFKLNFDQHFRWQLVANYQRNLVFLIVFCGGEMKRKITEVKLIYSFSTSQCDSIIAWMCTHACILYILTNYRLPHRTEI